MEVKFWIEVPFSGHDDVMVGHGDGLTLGLALGLAPGLPADDAQESEKVVAHCGAGLHGTPQRTLNACDVKRQGHPSGNKNPSVKLAK